MYFNVLPGQNKNLYILLMFMFLVARGILQEVHMDFMVSGHSYLPCDRGFGVIERVCKRKQKIQCPDHYVRIIENIEGTATNKMESGDFLDIKSLKKRITERKPKPPLLFSKASKIVISRDHSMRYKLTQGDSTCMVDLTKSKSKVPFAQEPIPMKYPDGKAIKIKEEKLEDLRHFHDFLEVSGRKWITEVVEQQRTANARPGECQDHEVTAVENLQCDDQFLLDYLTMPDPRAVPNPLQDMRQDIASDASDAADDFDADDAADEHDASDDLFTDDD